jgi:methyl-accepting chemotaxis protein
VAREAARASASRGAASALASEEAINGVLERFRGVTESLEASATVLKRENAGIQTEIVESLVQLQFQDRVSQRMTHVHHNIGRLPELLARSRRDFDEHGTLAPVDASALLDELEGSYAMADERATHAQQDRPATVAAHAAQDRTGAVAAPAEAGLEEVTFF